MSDQPGPDQRGIMQAGETPVGISWLASFPKSGNTWTRILLSNLMARELLDDDSYDALPGSISSNRAAFDSVTGLPSSDMTADEIDLLRPDYYRCLAQDAEKRLFTKVHDGYHKTASGEPMFPADCSFGAVYLVRHPFDVAVSYASHQGHENYDRIVRQLNDPNHLMAGHGHYQLRQRTLGWSKHYLSWTRQQEIPVLVIRYEDMLEDTAACLKKIAAFLQLEEWQDDAAIAAAVEESRFDRLRAKEDEFGFREKPENVPRFFRSGRAGDGQQTLSQDQQDRLYEYNSDVMDELGYSH